MLQVPSFRLARREGIVSRGGAENAERSAKLALHRYLLQSARKSGPEFWKFFWEWEAWRWVEVERLLGGFAGVGINAETQRRGADAWPVNQDEKRVAAGMAGRLATWKKLQILY
jgi:hypothetical protein